MNEFTAHPALFYVVQSGFKRLAGLDMYYVFQELLTLLTLMMDNHSVCHAIYNLISLKNVLAFDSLNILLVLTI